MTPYDPRKHLLSCRQRDQNWFGPPCTLHVVPPRNCTFGHFQTNRRRQSLRLFAKAARIFPDIRRLFRNGPNECKIGLFLPSHDLWYLNFWPPVHSIQVRSRLVSRQVFGKFEQDLYSTWQTIPDSLLEIGVRTHLFGN